MGWIDRLNLLWKPVSHATNCPKKSDHLIGLTKLNWKGIFTKENEKKIEGRKEQKLLLSGLK